VFWKAFKATLGVIVALALLYILGFVAFVGAVLTVNG
jgi:hypothetical protein